MPTSGVKTTMEEGPGVAGNKMFIEPVITDPFTNSALSHEDN